MLLFTDLPQIGKKNARFCGTYFSWGGNCLSSRIKPYQLYFQWKHHYNNIGRKVVKRNFEEHFVIIVAMFQGQYAKELISTRNT